VCQGRERRCRVAIDKLVRERGSWHAQRDESIVGFEMERVFLPWGEEDSGVGARPESRWRHCRRAPHDTLVNAAGEDSAFAAETPAAVQR
jgi:hypothetical protein